MDVRTTTQSVTFPRPFVLTGVEAEQPAGIYIVETDEEPIPEVSFVAYRRVSTRIRLAADPRHPGTVETMPVDPAEIERAFAEPFKDARNGAPASL